MKYTVRYRKPDGRLSSLVVEAERRSDVFQELNRQGINAISISEGVAIAKPRRKYKGIVGISASVIIAVIIALWIGGNKVNDNQSAKTQKEKMNEVALLSGKTSKPKEKTFTGRKNAVKTEAIEKPILRNPDVFLTPKTKARVVKWKHREEPVFKNTFESFVGSVMTAIPGERFLDIDLEDEFDEAFQSSLTNKIEITKEDSEEVVALKQAVIDAKNEVRRLVQQGQRPRDIVLEARNELNKIADYRDGLQSEFDKYLVTEKDPNEVLKFVKEANEMLEEYGALPLDAPDDIESAEEALLNAKENRMQELEILLKEENQESKENK